MTVRLIATVLLLAAAACAQFENGSSDLARRVRIRIAFDDHGSCNAATRVVLTGNMGFAFGEGSVNGECVAEFFDVPPGRYRVSIQGEDAANADQGDVEVNPVISQDLEVRARHGQGSDPARWVGSASFVAVADLKMPASAAKEFEKAGRLIEKQNWEKASEHLRKGLATYSTYAAGYNNLGAIYVRLGNIPQAREAFQKAVGLDDRLAAPYVNLARLSFMEKDYPTAESFLQKAIGLAPAENVDELILLAYSELFDKHLNDAIRTSQQGHALRFKQHVVLHLVAASAFEQQARVADSIQELQMYVSEEPNGPQTERVKRAMATLQAQIAAH